MTTELSTGADAFRWFSPLTWRGLLLRMYVALAFLLSGLVATVVGVSRPAVGGLRPALAGAETKP